MPPWGAVLGEIALNLMVPVGTIVTLPTPILVESSFEMAMMVTTWGVVFPVMVDGVTAVGTAAGAVKTPVVPMLPQVGLQVTRSARDCAKVSGSCVTCQVTSFGMGSLESVATN